MNNPFDFFDKIYCVHLPQHKSRLKLLKAQCSKQGMLDRVEFVHAEPPGPDCTVSSLRYPQGEFGAWLSHGKAIVHAIADGAERPLFIEDDMFFRPGARKAFSTVVAELPTDWDILFLSGTPFAPMQRVTSSISSISGRFNGAVAYSIPKRSLVKFHDYRLDLLVKLKPLADSSTNQFAQNFNGYTTTPPICLSHPGLSTIRNANRDYNKRILARFEKFTSELPPS